MRPSENISINEIDSEALFSKDPSYIGEAEINDKSFEPRGIEVPTQIFSSAEEAIQLENFPPEVRKYIKRIFLERYPNCVSLHSLDAGDLSLTLGFTQLKLKEGETLPRSKRIFHISPPDA